MLVGRDQEQQLLDRLLDDARDGRSGVLAIVGDVGVGKSALLAYARQHAKGMNVLQARGVQSEAQIPFAGLFELLRPALGSLRRIPQPQAAALEGALALRPARSEDRFAVGAATLSLLAASAEVEPLLVIVDDAHWIDGSTADALLFAFRRLVADAIAVVLSVRDGEPSLLEGADLPILRLEGLDRPAAADLLASHASQPVGDDLIDRLHRQTGGNPLALIELARETRRLQSPTPFDTPLPAAASIAQVYIQRCQSLPERTRHLLLLAAASDTGGLSDLARAARAVGLDLVDLADAETAGLVVIADDRLEFLHPLARSAIYSDAAADRRREAHRALADALPDADIDRRAWHLALAALGPDDAACSALEQAGNRARERSAYDVASQTFERAARLAPDDGRRGRLLYAAADTSWLGGLAARSILLLDEARRWPDTPRLAISIEHLRGHIAARLGPVSEGQRILRAGAEQAATTDPELAVVMLADAVNAAFYAGDVPAMQDAAARIDTLASPTASRRGRFLAAIARGMALVFAGDGERGADLLREATALVNQSDELADDPRLLTWAIMGPLWLREAPAGRALIDRALRVSRRKSAIGLLPHLLSHVALDQAASDRWAEAEAGFHQAMSLARETDQRTDLAFVLARLAGLEARQGKEPDCRAHADEALELSRQLGVVLCEIWALAAIGDLELGLGHADAAVAQFEQQRALLLQRGIGDADLSPVPELVELYLRLGHPQQAAALTPAFELEAATKSQPWALARAARCRGMLAPNDQLDHHFDLALAHHQQTPDLFETARTRLAYGARLRRSRQRVRARDELRVAIDAFDRLGATPWSDSARAELAATGETARRRDPTTLHQLTPQELQIALLLAEGRTTREAASTMFVSPKTIEYHLRSVYRKLEINSRDKLSDALATAIATGTAPSTA